MIYKVLDTAGPAGPGNPLMGLAFLGVLILPRIFYLLTMGRALSRCAPRNRTLTPGLVWLSIIPMFGNLWDFVIVLTVGRNLTDEARSRSLQPAEDNPGLAFGIAYCLLNLFFWIPFINIFTGLASLICWIVYWAKIAAASRLLADSRPSGPEAYGPVR